MRYRTYLLLAALLCAGCAQSRQTQHNVDPSALGPYSSSVRRGDILYLAGKIGRDRESFETEVHSAIDSVEQELEAVSYTHLTLPTILLV